jgi:hypothetical protein
MKKYSKLFKRVQAFILVAAMLLSMSNLGLFLNVSAADSGSTESKTDGSIVADNYELTEAEKALLKSGYLVGDVHEYTKPESSSLIYVDIDNKKITAQEYNGGSGYVWIPVSADIVVNGEVKEPVALTEGNGTYAYAGSAFSVKVNYELRIDVDFDLQKDLLSAPAWLKQGIVNMDAVSGESGNLYIFEQAMPELVNFAKNGVSTPMGNVGFDDACKAAINAFDAQMKAMVVDCT